MCIMYKPDQNENQPLKTNHQKDVSKLKEEVKEVKSLFTTYLKFDNLPDWLDEDQARKILGKHPSLFTQISTIKRDGVTYFSKKDCLKEIKKKG